MDSRNFLKQDALKRQAQRLATKRTNPTVSKALSSLSKKTPAAAGLSATTSPRTQGGLSSMQPRIERPTAPTTGIGFTPTDPLKAQSSILENRLARNQAGQVKPSAQRTDTGYADFNNRSSLANSNSRSAHDIRMATLQSQRSSNSSSGSWDGSVGDVDVSGFSPEQVSNAKTIYTVGKRMGASDRDILIGIMTAMQESGLRNINYGDRDSLGLFQQRPSQGWGSPAQVTNPEYSASKFFEGLLKVSNRNNMALTAAAQAVQRSAFPNAYAKHEAKAASLLRALSGATTSGARSSYTTSSGLSPVRQKILDTAFSMLGINYSLGGGGIGVRQSKGASGIGVDCSGLTSYVYGTIGIKLPRYSNNQTTQGYRTSITNAQPGDLVGWDKGGHVAIYIGNGKILHSPRPGQKVQIRSLFKGEKVYAVKLRLPGE